MSHYLYQSDSNKCHSLRIQAPHTQRDLYALTGRPAVSYWKPIAVSYERAELAGNFPLLTSHVPVFDQGAIEALAPLLGAHVELLCSAP